MQPAPDPCQASTARRTNPPRYWPSRSLLTFLGGWLVPFGVVMSLEFGQRVGSWATLAALALVVAGLAGHERHADHSRR